MLKKKRYLVIFALAFLVILTTASVVLAEGGPQPQVTEAMFSGPIEHIPQGYLGVWQIGGKQFQVTERTQFQPPPQEMQLGDMVQVMAMQRNREMLALQIQKMGHMARPDHLFGRIESIEDSTWVIRGITIFLTDQTVLRGDLPAEVGDYAWVTGEIVPEGMTARHIVVKDPRPLGRMVMFTGVVEEIVDHVWSIRLDNDEVKTVLETDQTRLVNEPGVGDRVGVKGLLQEEGEPIFGLLIVKLDQTYVRTPFAGFVTELVAGVQQNGPTQWVWVVERPALGQYGEPASWMVVVDAATDINVDPGSVEVGMWVKGVGEELAPGEIAADVVRVTRPPSVRFQGLVEGMPAIDDPQFPLGTWIIGGTTVIVNEHTQLRGPVPQMGDEVLGSGFLQMDNTIVAQVMGKFPRR